MLNLGCHIFNPASVFTHLFLLHIHTEPQMHLFFTGIGFYLGYLAHRYEEGSEERTERLLAKYRHAPRAWVEMVKQDDSMSATFLIGEPDKMSCLWLP